MMDMGKGLVPVNGLRVARKYIEQWCVWCVVDIACSALYIYKELYFTAILYLLYAIIAIFGYFKWKKMMQNEG